MQTELISTSLALLSKATLLVVLSCFHAFDVAGPQEIKLKDRCDYIPCIIIHVYVLMMMKVFSFREIPKENFHSGLAYLM